MHLKKGQKWFSHLWQYYSCGASTVSTSCNGQTGKRRIGQIKYLPFPTFKIHWQAVIFWRKVLVRLSKANAKRNRKELTGRNKRWLYSYTCLTTNIPNALWTVCHFWKMWRLLPAVFRSPASRRLSRPKDCCKACSCLTLGHSSTDWWQMSVNFSPYTNLWVPPWTGLTGALARV